MSKLQNRFKSERIRWTHDELVICLAYYFFIYEYNTRKKDYEIFAYNLRTMTGNKRSNGSVGVRFANYISIDPRKQSTGFNGGNPVCYPIWNECIDNNYNPKKDFIISFLNFIKKYGNKNLEIYKIFLSKYKSISKNFTYDEMVSIDIENINHISKV